MAQPFLGQRLGAGLLRAGHRNSPMVVLADKDCRCMEHTGKVKRLVKVALRCGAVAEKYQSYVIFLPVAHAVSDTHRMRDLGAHRNRVGQVAEVIRHGSTLVVTAVIKQDALHAPATIDLGSSLSECRHQPVGLTQRGHGP